MRKGKKKKRERLICSRSLPIGPGQCPRREGKKKRIPVRKKRCRASSALGSGRRGREKKGAGDEGGKSPLGEVDASRTSEEGRGEEGREGGKETFPATTARRERKEKKGKERRLFHYWNPLVAGQGRGGKGGEKKKEARLHILSTLRWHPNNKKGKGKVGGKKGKRGEKNPALNI